MMQFYGQGPSTTLDQTALGKINTGFVPDDVAMSAADASVLKRLAENVAAIAATEGMAETRELWRRHNMLEKVRPLIFCDPENGWNEIITETQMQCSGTLARRWEMDLRKELFWGEEMGDDKPVQACFDVPYTVREDDWGLATAYRKPSMRDGAQSWEGPIEDYDRDLQQLHAPIPDIDWETTRGTLAIAEDVFAGILDVRLKGNWWWSLGITLPAVLLRGMTNMLTDFLDQPDNLKELFSRIADGHLAKLDWLEQNGLLSPNSDGTYVGSGGWGFTDELLMPQSGSTFRCGNLWGFAESQETVNVSPAMYEEFVFPNERRILDRFGLNCYGCCEPIDPRWHVVKQHPRLRRVSCSPWADYEKMADNLGDRYIFSMKPNPAALALPAINTEAIRAQLRRNLAITRGCRVEIIMKDNHTIGGRPENVVEWCRIAREEVGSRE